jgi:uncharacterized membrane protein
MKVRTSHARASIRGIASRAQVRMRHAERLIRSRLTWNRLYRATSYVKTALWIVPFAAILLVLAVVPVLRAFDAWLGWRLVGLEIAGAQALYQTVITLALSFMVFTFGSLLVAIQVASGQLTPRIIATTLLGDNVVRYSVGLFVFTLVLAVSALNRLDKSVPELVALVVAILGIVCMAAFLFLIDYAARLLRPVSICARIGDDGIGVIRSVYPGMTGDAPDGAVRSYPPLGAPARMIRHAGAPGIVLAVDLATIVAAARRCDGVIEFVPQVGEFVASDEPLFALYGGAVAVDEHTLRATVAFGAERTLEQDPLFAFRILVDIALKALSPAINDPTTGVLAIDQIHRLLRAVGKRQLRAEEILDGSGQRRAVYRTPNWEDYVQVAFSEIRSCGAGNVQIARRLRAMLDNLVASLPAHRHPPLQEERASLDRALELLYPIAQDLALARVPDSQGLGGSSGKRTADGRFADHP